MSRVYVAGVGMIPFAKPGASEPYDVMGAAATKLALADAGVDYGKIQQAYVGYVYGDSTCGPARALSGRHDRHPDRQRQQQLLDRLDRAVPRAPGGRERRGRLRAGARLRADEARCAGLGIHRPADAVRRFRRAAGSWSTRPDVPLALRYFGGAGLEPHEEVRHDAARPSPRSAPRRAATPRTIRWRCSARK